MAGHNIRGTFSLYMLKVPLILFMYLGYVAGARFPACRCSVWAYFAFTSVWCPPFLVDSNMCFKSIYSSLRL